MIRPYLKTLLQDELDALPHADRLRLEAHKRLYKEGGDQTIWKEEQKVLERFLKAVKRLKALTEKAIKEAE